MFGYLEKVYREINISFIREVFVKLKEISLRNIFRDVLHTVKCVRVMYLLSLKLKEILMALCG